MTQDEINLGNKIIAMFMGQDKAFDPRDKIYHYNESWDWLMPVVDRIADTLLINGDTKMLRYLTVSYLATFKKDLIFKTAVEFIEWYNINYKNENKIIKKSKKTL